MLEQNTNTECGLQDQVLKEHRTDGKSEVWASADCSSRRIKIGSTLLKYMVYASEQVLRVDYMPIQYQDSRSASGGSDLFSSSFTQMYIRCDTMPEQELRLHSF